MKKIVCLFVLFNTVICFSLSFPKREVRAFFYTHLNSNGKPDTVSCSQYEVLDGMLDGKYISWWDPHKRVKRAEGVFKHNQRYGLWTVWDEAGKMRMQRNYKNGFEFERIYPAVSKEGPIPLLIKDSYCLQYNKDSCVDYAEVHERAVVYQKRIWRMLSVKDNPVIAQSKLFQILYEKAIDSSVTAFGITGNDESFSKTMTSSEVKSKIIPGELTITGYKIKEDFYFDWDRMTSETRIIGICPVAINKVSGDSADLFWIYYPQIRKFLAKEKVGSRYYPQEVKTLDDVFFFRDFASQIYKESNIYDRAIADYLGKGSLQYNLEAERIEMDMLNAEHDIWISFTKKE